MGYSKPRRGKNGTRYTAVYTDHDGKERSAGTFPTEEEADTQWKEAELRVKQGRGSQLLRGRTLFKDYVEQDWLPNHVMEATTRQSYTYGIYAHILPTFQNKRMIDILAIDVKRWLAALKEAGMSASNRKLLKSILGSILGSAVDEEILVSSPTSVVRTDPVPEKPLAIVSPEQFDKFHDALTDEKSQLLVQVAIETGMRWGELTELRPKDFDTERSGFTVSRAVVHLVTEFHPEGKRFLVKEYPKGRDYRFIKIDVNVGARIAAYIEKHQIGRDELLFQYVPKRGVISTLAATPEGKDLGFTEPSEKGKTYRHGTTTAYTDGKCRCQYCRAAMADYRRSRRENGKDSPRPMRSWDTDGHIPNRSFRDTVIRPALKIANIPVDIKMHRLRHAHASWLLNGGADLVVVKARLGHKNIRTTEKYLHTMENADETALEALRNVRQRPKPATPLPEAEPSAVAADSQPDPDRVPVAEPAVAVVSAEPAVQDPQPNIQHLLLQMGQRQAELAQMQVEITKLVVSQGGSQS